MRKFKIKNAIGEIYDLTVKESEFLFNVAGLGYSDNVEYRRIANFYKRLTDYKNQGVINGTIHFFGNENPHQRYFNLVNFLQKKPLTLIYVVEDVNKTFYRVGTVTDMTFSESNCLKADIKFTCTTLWYERVEEIFVPDSGQLTGKKYNYTYNYVYRNTKNNTVSFNIETNELSPVKLSLYGKLVNPEWVQYVNGVEVARGKVNYTIANGYYLVIDTTDVPYSIKEYDVNNNFIADLYNVSDFSTARFINLQAGVNTLVVTDEEQNAVMVKAEAMINYASV